MTSWDPPDRPSVEMQAVRRPHVLQKGKTAATAAAVPRRLLKYNYATCISMQTGGEHAGVAVTALTLAIFPFYNTCARIEGRSGGSHDDTSGGGMMGIAARSAGSPSIGP